MSYIVPAAPISVTHQVKRSRFVCTIEHCPTREVAEGFIRRISQQYCDANHNCWAMVAGPPEDPHCYGMSDDGEPRGCAGKPIFNVLSHSGIGEIAVVVSRWFGGIKLGTGGMARAYGGAARQGIEALTITRKVFFDRYSLLLPYDLQQTVEYLLLGLGGKVTNISYSELVVMEVQIPKDETSDFLEEIREKGMGRINLRRC